MDKEKSNRILRICYNYIFPLLLLLYPLRHIHLGLDLWDTGYSYANFRYMGLDHMDPMWLFSTYLANGVGHILTLLPGGHTLLFLNLYTGLFVSITVLLTYFFCTRRVGMPAPLVFWGELVAASLCWCPTAVLYNYLTYLFLLLCLLLLYEGLTKDRSRFLILAGTVLGANVLVRFSNLPQMALIIAVWVYGIICRKKPLKVLKETGFCLLGYAAALGIGLGYITLRYGLGSYVEGISRLFAMTDTAADYKPISMLYGMFLGYRQNIYWFIRLLCFVLLGLGICYVLPKKLKKVKTFICAALALSAVAWLYYRKFCSLRFDEYEAMLRPGILFLMLTLTVCGIKVLQPSADKKEKLFSGMIFLVVLLTPIGSNNGLYPAINNLFLALPYVLYCFYRFCKKKDGEGRLSFLPFKAVWGGFLALLFFQSIGFGLGFVFVEAHGAANVDTKAENNDVLKGIYMSAERAEWLSGISAYVQEEGLAGREVILYGEIPSMSFYLGMPSAFNPWCDLASYGESVMAQALKEVEQEIQAGEDAPVIILDRKFTLYKQGGETALEQAGYSESEINKVKWDTKQELLWKYMESWGYEEVYSDSKFVLYRTEKRTYD